MWTFRCQEGGTTGVVTSSGYINDWDASFYYSCPSNKVLVGMGGYHDNRKEVPNLAATSFAARRTTLHLTAARRPPPASL